MSYRIRPLIGSVLFDHWVSVCAIADLEIDGRWQPGLVWFQRYRQGFTQSERSISIMPDKIYFGGYAENNDMLLVLLNGGITRLIDNASSDNPI